MDLPNDIWTALNQEWVVTVTPIVSLILVVVGLWKNILGVTSAIRRWRVWTIIVNIYRAIKKRHRMRQAKNAMYAKLDQTYITIQIGTYDHCLRQTPNIAGRGQLDNVTPEKPRWLNDYFVANALASLASENKIVKAVRCNATVFPPSPLSYLFRRRQTDKSTQDEAKDIETNDQCAIYQSFQECPRELRYKWGTHAETTAPGRTEFRPQMRLKDGAPPCERCWETKALETDTSMLVENITKYDLAATATTEITGENNEFQQAVINVCMENKCQADAGTIREIVRKAIEIRRNQLEFVAPGQEFEWTAQSTEEFSASLSAYINEEAQ